MTMFQSMTEEQLRELIQGPQDVEWKYALPLLSPDCWFPITYAPSANDDRYEMRRECQEILPGLILGPLQAAKSLDILQRLGVTHVYALATPLFAIGVANLVEHVLARYSHRVCIRDAKEAFSVKPRFPDAFKYMVVDLADSEEQNLIRYFPA